ncbi:MAG TPA: NYN domain-containing protein [Phycisphaerae bacterium]|nr:NYN domain-containing protein [Phycisphaerae bacterium]
MSRRSIIYIDGFNLYYGAVKGSPHKWLDIQRMCERLRQDDEIQLIRYFTARVDGPTRANQDAYLRALATSPKIETILGNFKTKRFKCRVSACTFAGSRFYVGTEEKRTDVSIAVMLLDDAYQDKAERFVIISGDSDLVPSVNLLKLRFPEKQVIVYVPSRDPRRGAAVELRSAADKNRSLPMELIQRSQFPREMPDGHGGTIRKPVDW